MSDRIQPSSRPAGTAGKDISQELALNSLPSLRAASYYDILEENGLLSPFHDLEAGRYMHLSAPICLQPQLAGDLEAGCNLGTDFIREHYKDPSDVYDMAIQNIPSIDGRPLLTEQSAANTFDLWVNSGATVPCLNDVIITRNGPQVVEFQSALPYMGEVFGGISALEESALRVGPTSQSSRAIQAHHGNTDPVSAVSNFRAQHLGRFNEIAVIDVDPLHDGSIVDQVQMARCFGKSDSLPLALLNIDLDKSGEPFLFREKLVDGKPVLTADRVYPQAVIFRVTPNELRELIAKWEESGNERQLEALYKLFTNDKIFQVQNFASMKLIDKGTLTDFADFARAKQDPFASLLPRMHRAGDVLEHGDWAIKPLDGNSGRGFGIVNVSPPEYRIPQGVQVSDNRGVTMAAGELVTEAGRYAVSYSTDCGIPANQRVHSLLISSPENPFRVPADHLAQERFDFSAIEVQVPERVARAVRGTELYISNSSIRGNLEVRAYQMPSRKEEGSTLFGYRCSPYVDSSGQIVLTNLAPAMKAYDEILQKSGIQGKRLLESYRQSSMFGFGAAYLQG